VEAAARPSLFSVVLRGQGGDLLRGGWCGGDGVGGSDLDSFRLARALICMVVASRP
jgi:hypothetical protein